MLAEGQMKKTYLILLLPLFLSNLFAREYIAIIDFKGLNISENDSKALTQRLTSEMIKLEILIEQLFWNSVFAPNLPYRAIWGGSFPAENGLWKHPISQVSPLMTVDVKK